MLASVVVAAPNSRWQGEDGMRLTHEVLRRLSEGTKLDGLSLGDTTAGSIYAASRLQTRWFPGSSASRIGRWRLFRSSRRSEGRSWLPADQRRAVEAERACVARHGRSRWPLKRRVDTAARAADAAKVPAAVVGLPGLIRVAGGWRAPGRRLLCACAPADGSRPADGALPLATGKLAAAALAAAGGDGGLAPSRRRVKERLHITGHHHLHSWFTVPVMELWELVARERIRDTLARYNWSGDALRLDEFAQTFCEDGELELRERGSVRGRTASSSFSVARWPQRLRPRRRRA